MKGLIIKDFYCLKKQFINYVAVIIGLFVITIMFVLSFNHGNIYISRMDMIADGQATLADTIEFANKAMIFVMLLPIVCAGDLDSLFRSDHQAGFYKIASGLPISTEKRIASRFITAFIFVGVGALIDIIIVLILSMLTDVVGFTEFANTIVSFSSLMFIYGCVVILLMYMFGTKISGYAGIIPFITVVAALFISGFEGIKRLFVYEDDSILRHYFDNIHRLITGRSYVLLLTAIITFFAVYPLSVFFAKRRKGVA